MNVIQWLYKNEQVQTTLSKIIQWLSMLDVAPGLTCFTFETFVAGTDIFPIYPTTFCFQL
jgi:hypothetical protein